MVEKVDTTTDKRKKKASALAEAVLKETPQTKRNKKTQKTASHTEGALIQKVQVEKSASSPRLVVSQD